MGALGYGRFRLPPVYSGDLAKDVEQVIVFIGSGAQAIPPSTLRQRQDTEAWVWIGQVQMASVTEPWAWAASAPPYPTPRWALRVLCHSPTCEAQAASVTEKRGGTNTWNS